MSNQILIGITFILELGDVKSFIEKLFTYEKQESILQADLQELLTAISKKILELKNENNRMTKFLIAMLNDIAKFIRTKLSEMKIELFPASKFVIPEKTRQTLFDYHSQILEKMEVPNP